jgi:hypothetical protein
MIEIMSIRFKVFGIIVLLPCTYLMPLLILLRKCSLFLTFPLILLTDFQNSSIDSDCCAKSIEEAILVVKHYNKNTKLRIDAAI